MKKKPKPIPVPRTRSKNPVTILRAVARAILDEPKRYDQGDYLSLRSDYQKAAINPNEWPSCGTRACVAGWTVVVCGQLKATGTVHDKARALLNLSVEQANALFSDSAFDAFDWSAMRSGTLRYAKAGVAHIRRFVKEVYGKDLGTL